MAKNSGLMVWINFIVILVSLSVDGMIEEDTYNNYVQGKVTIGGRVYHLLFEIPDIPEGMKATIARDIEQTYADFGKMGIKKIDNEDRPHFFKKYDIVSYFLQDSDYNARLPEVLKDHFGNIIMFGNTCYMTIPSEIVNAYKKAFKLKNEHKEAFEKVDGFLRQFNDKESRRQIAKDIEGAKSLFSFHGVEPWDDLGIYQSNLALTENAFLEVETPSLLDFQFYQDVGGLIFLGTMKSRDEDETEIGMARWPFVYKGGKWRLLIYRLP